MAQELTQRRGRTSPSSSSQPPPLPENIIQDHVSIRHRRSNESNRRYTLGGVIVGVLIGYVLLPLITIEYIGFESMSKTPSSINIKLGKVRNLDKKISSPDGPHIRRNLPFDRETAPLPLKRKPASSSRHATPPLVQTAEERLAENMELISSQSMSTFTTPQIMKTPSLPDHLRKKILITGGAGFVGSHLVDKLMMIGHEVIVLDNFFTGQKRNVEHWLRHPNFSLIVHDVIEPIMIEVDEIYHLACPASPPHYQYNPIKTIKTSTMGTLNMLGLAKRVKAKILLTSTSEIYGDPLVHPQKESYWGNVNTIGPRSCYDEGKRVAETMMYSYRNQDNVKVRVARIFNTFGPRMHPNDGRVVSNFIIQALQNKELTIYGSGEQTRSFQYVSDLVDGLYKLMNNDYDLPVNLGNPDEYSVKNFAQHVKDLTKSKSEIKYLEKMRDDPAQRKPDIRLAKAELDWSPVVPVNDGLEKTIAYFKKVLEQSGEIIPTGPGAAKPHPNES